jgi:dipeptidyl aminopeptidase/acylaminoacyl peptidase
MNLSDIKEIIKFKKINFDKKYPEHVQKLSKKHKNVEIINIFYKSDKLKIQGYIYRKKNIKKNTPVVIFCRGGNNHPSIKTPELLPGTIFSKNSLLELIEKGKIIVFASNYRGSSKSEGTDEFGGKDINDIINLYPIIKKYKFSNEKNISLYAWSRGCTNALLVSKKVKWIKCLILGAGSYDYKIGKKARPKFHKKIKKYFKLNDFDLKERSAIYWSNKIPKIPILLLHGTADWRVSVENSIELSLELYKNKIPYKLVIYPGGNHILSEYTMEVDNEINMFINNYLLNDKKINLELHGK